jgi:hypothetical protein
LIFSAMALIPASITAVIYRRFKIGHETVA